MKEYRVWEAYGGGLYVIKRRCREKHIENTKNKYYGPIFKRWISDWIKYERIS